MIFEGEQGGIPEPADFLELRDQLFDRLAPARRQFIDTLAPILVRLDQTRPRQHASVLANRGTAYRKSFGERTGAAWSIGEASQQFPPRRIRERSYRHIDFRHDRYVTYGLRICQVLCGHPPKPRNQPSFRGLKATCRSISVTADIDVPRRLPIAESFAQLESSTCLRAPAGKHPRRRACARRESDRPSAQPIR